MMHPSVGGVVALQDSSQIHLWYDPSPRNYTSRVMLLSSIWVSA